MRSTGSQINPSTLGPGNASGVGVPSYQLFPQIRSGNYFPRALGAVGPGGITSTGSIRPAFPPQAAGPAVRGGTVSSPVGGGKGGTGTGATGGSFNLVSSPTLWAIGALFAGFVLLRYVHHGY